MAKDDVWPHKGSSVAVRRDCAALRSAPGRSVSHRDDSVSDGLQDGPPDIQIAAMMRTNEMTVEIQTLDHTKSHFHLTEAMPVLRCRLTTLERISEHLHDRLAGSRKRPSEQSTADRSIMHGTDRSDSCKVADMKMIVDLRKITSLNKITDIFRRHRSIAKRSIVRSTKARMGWTARRKTVTNSRAYMKMQAGIRNLN
jgi:hypothetical protein